MKPKFLLYLLSIYLLIQIKKATSIVKKKEVIKYFMEFFVEGDNIIKKDIKGQIKRYADKNSLYGLVPFIQIDSTIYF